MGLVEQQHVGPCEEDPCQFDAAALAAGEHVDGQVEPVVAEAEAGDQRAHLGLCGVPAGRRERLLGPGEATDRPVGGILLHGQAQLLHALGRLVEGLARQDVGQPRRVGHLAQLAGVLGQEAQLPLDGHRAVVGGRLAAEDLEQAGLAGPVAAHQPDLVTGADGEGRPFQCEASPDLDAQLAGLKHASIVAEIADLPARADVVVEWSIPTGVAELSADRLWAAGATALQWRDGDGTVALTASFPTPDAAALVAAEVGAALTTVEGTWRDVWREFAVPVRVGGLVVAPAWRDVPVGDGVVVRIDPGATFGSGSHASTRLVLGVLERDRPEGATVLDVGSGSGILSVAAALLGARSVTALDVDPDAVRVTTANAEANQVGERVRAAATPVAELQGTWEVGLVNVTAGVHAVIGPHVAARITPGGRLVLAGLLPGQWRHVAGAYPATTVVERPALDGWEGVVLRRDG